MPDRDHLAGCPAVLHPERAGRVESYVLNRPPQVNPDNGHVVGPARPVRVTRCPDCGEAVYEDVSEEDGR